MAESTLLLVFDAPFQSWGVGAKGTVRTTQDEPSFSGVVGLICNAMGLDRGVPPQGVLDLRMGVRIERHGVLTRDYYTAGTTTGIAVRTESRDDEGRRVFRDKVDKNGVVGAKYYLSGAHFTVALAGDAEVIEEVAQALRQPARPLYLGRRSCPVASPPVLRIVPGGDVEQALRSQPLPRDLHPKSVPSRFGDGAYVANRGWCAEQNLRLVLPTSPGAPDARMRQDMPVDYSDPHRRYGVRFVRFDEVDRDSLIPKKEVA